MSAKAFWASQDGHPCIVIPPQSAAAAVVGKRFSMAEWAHASILLFFGAAGGPTGAITLSVYQAESGGSGVAIPYRLAKAENASAPFDVFANNSATNNSVFPQTSAGYTPSADEANAMYCIEIDSADLLAAANGVYVELDVAVGSLGTTAQLLAAIALLSAGRVTGDQTASVQV
jgi:hypothetical protein